MPSLFRKTPPPGPPVATVTSGDTGGDAAEVPIGIPDCYVREPPSAQNAIDLFGDTWISSLPPRLGIHAGQLPTFNDTRMQALLTHLVSIKGFKILELGPMEGGHTYMLHEAGASITSIESSSRSYLKCLVIKEILNLNRAHFHLGDFVPYLDTTKDRFDLVMASGVLYHTLDPLHVLERIAQMTDKIAIWSHYWDAEHIAADENIAPLFATETNTVEWRGHSFDLHTRHYPDVQHWTGFCGGPEITASWMERDDLLAALAELGYETVTILDDDPAHANGPAILLCAER